MITTLGLIIVIIAAFGTIVFFSNSATALLYVKSNNLKGYWNSTLLIISGFLTLEEGMSKRFWAATLILQGIVQGLVQIPIETMGTFQSDVEVAYGYADELLKQEFENGK